MRILHFGMIGNDVLSWQTFLRGTNNTPAITLTSNFDQATLDATKQFQRAYGATQDGIVGPSTLSKALHLGFSVQNDERSEDDKLSGNWPPLFNDVRPLTSIEIEQKFGNFAYVSTPIPTNPEQITITDSWAADNIVTINMPQLKLTTNGHTLIQCHVLAADQIKKVFSDWEMNGLMSNIITWGGSWAPRFKRGSRTSLSNHAWGTAFDINVQWNALGVRPALVGQTGSVRELVNIAHDNGFFWGGHFKTRLDGMHFECCNVI